MATANARVEHGRLGGASALIILVGLGLLVLSSSAFTVQETEQAIILQMGEPVGDAVTTPGLHFKLPFIQEARTFEKRWLEWDGAANEMPTKEKTYIWVDAFARWRISDPLKFYTSVRDERGAQSRLDDIIGSETRNVIAAYNLIDVVRETNRNFAVVMDVDVDSDTPVAAVGADDGDQAPRVGLVGDRHGAAPENVEVGRTRITAAILEKARGAMPDYGIELVDIQFQRVNYTESVKRKILERMISERKKFSDRYRSEGEAAASRIDGQKNRDLKTIESESYRQVQQIRGTADARATAIYAKAYNRDPKFYRFMKTLESYEATIDENSWMVLSSDSDYVGPLVDYSQ